MRPDVGHVTFTISGCGPIVTLVDADAVMPLASLTVNDCWNVPLVGWVAVWVPVPVYGVVPPAAVTVQLKALPAVRPDVGHVTVTTSG